MGDFLAPRQGSFNLGKGPPDLLCTGLKILQGGVTAPTPWPPLKYAQACSATGPGLTALIPVWDSRIPLQRLGPQGNHLQVELSCLTGHWVSPPGPGAQGPRPVSTTNLNQPFANQAAHWNRIKIPGVQTSPLSHESCMGGAQKMAFSRTCRCYQYTVGVDPEFAMQLHGWGAFRITVTPRLQPSHFNLALWVRKRQNPCSEEETETQRLPEHHLYLPSGSAEGKVPFSYVSVFIQSEKNEALGHTGLYRGFWKLPCILRSKNKQPLETAPRCVWGLLASAHSTKHTHLLQGEWRRSRGRVTRKAHPS